jgi:hypothetical protein
MNMEHIKRQWIVMGALLPFAGVLTACKAAAMGERPSPLRLTPAQERLRNMGLALVVDAVEGAEMLGVEFFADRSDVPFYAKSRMVRSNREIMAFPGGIVPETVRVTWRKNASEGYRDKVGRIRYSAQIVGDYSIPIASRIPEDVIAEIRRRGGGLRLKFRLKPDGVLFGWDIERFEGGLPRHSMPGGDFLETWY